MISVTDALTMVLDRSQALQPLRRSSAESLYHVLAQDIPATLDSPPHDKALVDGYAVRSQDLIEPRISLHVLEEITAGNVPTRALVRNSATRIMTGAPIPEGADAVVMVEQTEITTHEDGTQFVQLHDAQVKAGQNILRRAESMRAGEIVLRCGQMVRGIELGLLAELGIGEVLVYPRPTVAIVATGNELVPSTDEPVPGQIRNSNGPMLGGMAIEAHARPADLGIAADNMADLTRLIRKGLESDILILSGGVSAGVLDLVPSVLKQLAVQQVFHKVDLKPGKPLWFGVAASGDRPDTLVFGLPGNPVSSLVCFHLFVRPAIARLAGRASEGIQKLKAKLSVDHTITGNRPTYFPGRAVERNEDLWVEPLPWRGSADLRTLTDANALIYFPPEPKVYRSAELVTIWLL